MFEIESDPDPLSTPVFSRDDASSSAPVSPEIYSRTRKNEGLILRRMGEVGQGVVAAGIGVNDSQISRMKESGAIERTAKILAILGLKIVPEHVRCSIDYED